MSENDLEKSQTKKKNRDYMPSPKTIGAAIVISFVVLNYSFVVNQLLPKVANHISLALVFGFVLMILVAFGISLKSFFGKFRTKGKADLTEEDD